jgi:hypothetical protein
LEQKKWENKIEIGQTHRSAPTENNVGMNLCVHPDNYNNIRNILSSEKKLAGSEAVEKIMDELKLPFVKNYLVKSEKQAEEIFEKI